MSQVRVSQPVQAHAVDPGKVAADTRRVYGGAAFIEPMWRLRFRAGRDNAEDALWHAVLDFLGGSERAGGDLSADQAAAAYRAHLADPVGEVMTKIEDIAQDPDEDLRRFWSQVLRRLLADRPDGPEKAGQPEI